MKLVITILIHLSRNHVSKNRQKKTIMLKPGWIYLQYKLRISEQLSKFKFEVFILK